MMAANKPTTFKVPGTDVELPQWAIIAGAGGLAAVFLFMKNGKGEPSRPGVLTQTTPTMPTAPKVPDEPQGLPSPVVLAPSKPQKSVPPVAQTTVPSATIVLAPPDVEEFTYIPTPPKPVVSSGMPGVQEDGGDRRGSPIQKKTTPILGWPGVQENGDVDRGPPVQQKRRRRRAFRATKRTVASQTSRRRRNTPQPRRRAGVVTRRKRPVIRPRGIGLVG